MRSVLPVYTSLYPLAEIARRSDASDRPQLQWDCPRCTLINTPTAIICAVCDGPRPPEPEPEEDPAINAEEDEEGGGAADGGKSAAETKIDWFALFQERYPIDPPVAGMDYECPVWLYNNLVGRLYKVHIKPVSFIKRLRFQVQDFTGIPIHLQKLEHVHTRTLDVDFPSTEGGFGESRRRLLKDTLDYVPLYVNHRWAQLSNFGVSARSIVALDIIGAKARAIWKASEASTNTQETWEVAAMQEEKESYLKFVAETRKKAYGRLAACTSSDKGIFIKTLTGKTLWLRCLWDTTVEDLMELIHDHEGIPPDQQRLISQSQELNSWPCSSVRSLGLNIGSRDGSVGGEPSVIHLVLKLRGD